MANYLQFKKDYNNHKSTIKEVLKNPGCQFKLTYDGLTLLNHFLEKTTSKINSTNIVDNPVYSDIYFNINSLKNKLNLTNKQFKNAIKKLKYYKLITFYTIKGGYTQIIYNYAHLNFTNFQQLLSKGIKLTKQQNFVPIVPR